MIKKFLSHWHYRKNRFAHALAYDRSKTLQEWHLWAWYRLGMYRSVVDASVKCHSCHGLFAQAVSLAACGKYEDIEAVIDDFISRPECKKLLISLADALAPFMPVKAFEIIKNDFIPSPLHSALLLRLGHYAEAAKVLQQAFERQEMKKFPELYLYYSNAEESASTDKKLDFLNRFYRSFDISPVILKDLGMFPSTLNVSVAEQPKIMNGPLVTVIMTTFETGHRADIAIESVLQQSYQNIELIVVDDKSDDETPNIIRSWVMRDKRVKFIQLAFNGGTYIAKNIGLQYAQGEFVTCHDSDDWSHPLKIERQVKPLLADTRLIATTSHWVRVQDDGVYYARPVHPLMRINPSSLLFRRREVIRHAGIWECVRTGADSEFLSRLRLVFGKKALKRVVEPLALGAHRNDSLMTSSVTGYSESGISQQRLSYWEEWSKRHIASLRHDEKPQYGVRKELSSDPLVMEGKEMTIDNKQAMKMLKENHNITLRL